MVCKTEDSISLYFPNSGVEVAPEESDLRIRKREYSVGEFQLHVDAGEFISENIPNYSPVIFRVGGIDAHRLMYTRDNIEFERTLQETDIAIIRLLDPTKILTRGTITKRFRSSTFNTIASYIFNNTDDQHDVISGYRFADGVDVDARYFAPGLGGASEDFVVAEGFGVEPTELGVDISSYLSNLDDVLAERVFGDSYTGINLRSATPLEATNRITDEFGLDYWVETDGTLVFGIDSSAAQIVGIADETDDIVLKRYSITNSRNQVNSVHASGADQEIAANIRRGTAATSFEGLRVEAQATDPTIDGVQLSGEIERGFDSLEDLEEAVTRTLIKELTNRSNGSVELNALASQNKEAITQLDVGDIIAIDDGVNIACEKELITGLFIIRSVDHKSNPRQGWSISLRVSQIPNVNEIVTQSTIYDATKDKEYDSFEQYREDVENDIPNVGSP